MRHRTNWMPNTLLREYGNGWSVRLLRNAMPQDGEEDGPDSYRLLVTEVGRASARTVIGYGNAVRAFSSETNRLKAAQSGGDGPPAE